MSVCKAGNRQLTPRVRRALEFGLLRTDAASELLDLGLSVSGAAGDNALWLRRDQPGRLRRLDVSVCSTFQRQGSPVEG
jgi:hypothetical protein